MTFLVLLHPPFLAAHNLLYHLSAHLKSCLSSWFRLQFLILPPTSVLICLPHVEQRADQGLSFCSAQSPSRKCTKTTISETHWLVSRTTALVMARENTPLSLHPHVTMTVTSNRPCKPRHFSTPKVKFQFWSLKMTVQFSQQHVQQHYRKEGY